MKQQWRKFTGFLFIYLLFISGDTHRATAQAAVGDTTHTYAALADSIARVHLDKYHASCISIALIDGDKVETYTYGYLDKKDSIKAPSATLFEIGSITKVFTATSFARCVRQGKMQYHDKLGQYLPPRTKPPHYQKQEIELIMLAQHTSGLPRLPGNILKDVLLHRDDPYARYTEKRLYRYLNGLKLERKPGCCYEYSNLGAGLLGDLVAKREATSYKSMITQHIVAPLQMQNTTFSLSNTQTMAQGYTEEGEATPGWEFDVMAGAGALRSDASDMAKFLSYNMYPETIKDTLLRQAVIETHRHQIAADSMTKVGLGWHISIFNGDSLYWHNGGTGGFGSFVGFTNGSKLGVVVLGNSAEPADYTAIALLKGLWAARNSKATQNAEGPSGK